MLKLLLTPLFFVLFNIQSPVVIPSIDPRRKEELFYGGNMAQEILYQKDENKLFNLFKNNLEQQLHYGSIDIIVSSAGCFNYSMVRVNIDKAKSGYQLTLYTYHQKELEKQIEEYLRGGNFAFKTTLNQVKFNELKNLLTVDSTHRSTQSNSITLKQGNNYLNVSDRNPVSPIYGYIVNIAKANNCYRLF
jgi:hypothetical protein